MAATEDQKKEIQQRLRDRGIKPWKPMFWNNPDAVWEANFICQEVVYGKRRGSLPGGKKRPSSSKCLTRDPWKTAEAFRKIGETEGDKGAADLNYPKKVDRSPPQATDKTISCLLDQKGYPIVYTYGACRNDGQPDARAGIGVFWGPDHPWNTSERVVGERQTNNIAEIQAATRAINQAKECGYPGINIHTDSKFVKNVATKWIQTWKLVNWQKCNGEPVENAPDFKDLAQAMEGINVEWTHVPAHAGHHGNEAADRLAKEGCLKN